MSSELQSFADELSQGWRELGSVLASRRLHASLHSGQAAALTPSKLRALGLLAEQGGLRVGELADRMGVDETTATRLADRLESAGVAERRGAPGDRRATLVALTPDGEALAAEVAARRREFFCDVLLALEPADRAELVRLTAEAAAALRSRSAELTGR